MPERIYLEDLLGGLAHDAVCGKITSDEFFAHLTFPEGVTLQDFRKELDKLKLECDDLSPSHAAGKIAQGLLNAYWNEKPTNEELAYEAAAQHHATLA